MSKLKNGFSGGKKIKIYQLPLVTRISLLLSATVFILLPLIALFLDIGEKWKISILLLVMIIFSIDAYILSFNLYICLDFTKNKLIIKEFPGIKKEEIDLAEIKEIVYSDGIDYKQYFTINIICIGYTKKIGSWSTGPSGRLIMFNRYKRQKRRILKFINKCNEGFKKNN